MNVVCGVVNLLLNSGVIGRFHAGSDGPLVDWSNRVDFFRDMGGPHAGQFARQGGEMAAQLIDLLPESLNLQLLSEDQRCDAGWRRQTIRFWGPGRRGAHHRWSLPEKQPGIERSSKVQQQRSSL